MFLLRSRVPSYVTAFGICLAAATKSFPNLMGGATNYPATHCPASWPADKATREAVDEPFNAPAAWAEFTALLRTNYAYFTRPSIDGEAILAYFEQAALAAPDKAAFRDVLQLIAHNFADPHFIVGPLDTQDYNVIPTSSDMIAHYQAAQFVVVDVRRDSEAEQQGVVPGRNIIAINGQTPVVAVEQVMGRPFATLSGPQIQTGINIALAGLRQHTRQLTLSQGAKQYRYTLRSPGEQAERLKTALPLSVERRGNVAIIRLNNSLGNYETIAAFQTALQQVAFTKGLVLDLRNTPSGGNTTVARGIMGHFIQHEQPYQIHVVPSEERRFGVPRKFVEYVLPIAPYYPGKVIVLGGHWTGSMGEGLLIGFNAFGIQTAGSELADLLGALFNERLELSDAKVDLGEELLLQVNGQPREDFAPKLSWSASDSPASHDMLLAQALQNLQ